MCAKYIKFVFQNNFLYLFLSRKGKPLGGPSSFCLSAHASCPYAPHDRVPLQSFAGTPVGGGPPRDRTGLGLFLLSAEWPGHVTGSLGWERTLGKGPPWSRANGLHAQAPKSERASQQNSQTAAKSSEKYRVLRTRGGPWEWGAHKGDAVPRWGITAFRLHVPAQPVTVCSFTHLRLLLIVYTALCFCRVNVCSSHQSLPATYRVVWPRNVTNLWLLKADWWGYGVRRSKDRRGSCFPYLTETYSF